MSMEESISLEETNKIRISLGLKPLTEDKAPDDDTEKQAEQNFAKYKEREAKDRDAKRIADGIAKVRNRRELNASLKGATLGEADGNADDTRKWLKRNKKREKELAKKRQEELEQMDKVFQQEYTERDLEGLKVSHDFDELNEGEARILTLKDSRILDNEEDELQNIEMAESEKDKKNKELKIKRRDYTGYDDEEFTEGNQGMKRAVLSKYDEFLEGPRETGFRLGGSVVSTKTKKEEELHQAAAAVNKSLLSIDYASEYNHSVLRYPTIDHPPENLESSDYLREGDIGFKKPKTKKKRPSRRKPTDTDEQPVESNGNEMEVDQKPIVPFGRERHLDANFVDDDELQAALARSRRIKLQQAKKLTPEQLAQRIAEQQAKEEAETVHSMTSTSVKVDEDREDEEESGLTFDDTSEFVRSVGLNPVAVKPEPREAEIAATQEDTKRQSTSRDASMAPGDEAVEELEAGEVVVKDEDEDDEMAMLNDIENAIKATEAEEVAAKQRGEDATATSTEQTYGSGMGATLNILRKQGILATLSSDQMDREKTQLQRDFWLAEQRRRVARRELDKLQARGGNKDQAQREYENRLREQQEARDNLEAFKNYKPDVNIVYYDEFGRELTPKEAWKALSHKFHGKGSGKMKTEKRLKKIAEEKKQLAMASGDTPLSMNRAFQQRQEKVGQAHFVLSVGNRGAVPQDGDFIDVQPLAKGKTEKQKKKKESKNAAQKAAESVGIMPLGGMTPVQMQSLSNGASPAPRDSASASPAPRPGFSRISSAVGAETPTSHGGTPVGDRERSKVAFGLKRKAGDEPVGSPAKKR